MVRINQQRWNRIKVDYYDESPCDTRTKHKKGDSETRSPMILGKSRNSLKFVNYAMQKYLSTCDLCEIALDNNNTKNKGNEEENSSASSSNEEDIDSDASVIKDNRKKLSS